MKKLVQKHLVGIEKVSSIELGISPYTYIGRYFFPAAHRSYRLHSHDRAIEFHYLYSGRQDNYQIGRKPYSFKSGDVFVAYPSEVHGTGIVPEAKGILYWLLITLEPEKHFLDYSDREGREVLSLLKTFKKRSFCASDSLRSMFDSIFLIYTDKSPMKKIRIRNVVTEIIACLSLSEQRNENTTLSPKIALVVNHLNRQKVSDASISLAELADIAGLTLPAFKKRFRMETGFPPLGYFLSLKIDKAKEMLADDNVSISTIAYDLNFSSSQHFATIFKRHTGMTPGQFRKSTIGIKK